MIKKMLFKNPQKGDYHSSDVDYIILDDRYAELSFGWLISGKWRWHIAKLKVRCLLKLSYQEPSQGLDSSADNGTELYRHPQKHSKYACILWFTLRCVPRVFFSLLRYLCHLIQSFNRYIWVMMCQVYVFGVHQIDNLERSGRNSTIFLVK